MEEKEGLEEDKEIGEEEAEAEEKGEAKELSFVGDTSNLEAIKISLASPEKIRSWSFGEVTKPETINYRTFRPEKGGLFCERIFGPTKNYECYCGKFKSTRYKGVICDRCGVEVTHSDVRRHRMGHIELVAPVSHIWYFKRLPSKMAILLNISVKQLERVLYYEAYIVSDPGDTPLLPNQILTEEEHREYLDKYGQKFKADMGAGTIKEILSNIDCQRLSAKLREQIQIEKSLKQKKLIRRLEVVSAFVKSDNRPEWTILEALPVIPTELRPMVQLDGGRFVTSDLNDLYRRVINRNNRLSRLIGLHAPEVIIRNEKRMLQEAVDALFDNSQRKKVVKGLGNRPLKSLSDMLRGKQGRFRQNLLGKRVDYSGRSVIVVDPTIKLVQCGLPKKMALELFKPFVMRRLSEKNLVHNIKSGKSMIESELPEVWDALEEVIKDYPVLLNRAPTLHKAGIQAFIPILVEGKAIKIHPLVCTAFNADFDGDQMAVHVPLSVEAQLEAKHLMLSAKNLLSPAHGKPLVAPSQDIVLGLCYLTKEKPKDKGEGRIFANEDEALLAYDDRQIGLHALISVRVNGQRIRTTVGRVIFNKILPEEMRFINEKLNKSLMGKIVTDSYLKYGLDLTVKLLDSVKELGFEYVTVFGGSIGIDDIKISEEKDDYIRERTDDVSKILEQYQNGIITEEERYAKVVDLWTHTTEKLTDVMFSKLAEDQEGFNPVFVMAESGARGSKQQIKQLTAMRGLMAKPSGEIIELPITSNFREGLSVLEYFISTHGARKGLADTALKTADAGYLTRRLVDVAQEAIISEEDCGTINGVTMEAIKEGDEIIEPLADRVLGRVALEDVIDPMTGKVLVKANQEIGEEAAARILEAEIERIRIRTALTCESVRGTCQRCYGRAPMTGKMVDIGEAVGIIAAQSIGEPGTQLTMRTFHIGGTAFRQVEERGISFNYPVEIIRLPKHLIETENNAYTISRRGEMKVRRVLAQHKVQEGDKLLVFDGLWVTAADTIAKRGKKEIKTALSGMVKFQDDKKFLIMSDEREIFIKPGAQIRVKVGDIVPPNQVIAEFDPYNEPILTEVKGRIRLKDVVKGRTVQEKLDENTGLYKRVVIDDREGELQPYVTICDEKEEIVASYIMPTGARISVNDGEEVNAGEVIAKLPLEITRTKDITGGLPRVADLFEARHPKEKAIISEIDGVVKLGEISGRTRAVIVKNEATKDERQYSVLVRKHLKVHNQDLIASGERLTDGPIDCHDILRIKGEKALGQYLLNEIQEVYRLQGVAINDKHIEVIIRQMLKRVEIIDGGDTEFLPGEQVDKFEFRKSNEEVIAKGGKPAQAKPILLGITKASLATDSFISAASFQETTKVLTNASIQGAVDKLRGLKENVIVGSLIPAGTGRLKGREISQYLKKEKIVV